MRETEGREVTILTSKRSKPVYHHRKLGEKERESLAYENQISIAATRCERSTTADSWCLTLSHSTTSHQGYDNIQCDIFDVSWKNKLNDTRGSGGNLPKCMNMSHNIMATLLFLHSRDFKLLLIQSLIFISESGWL